MTTRQLDGAAITEAANTDRSLGSEIACHALPAPNPIGLCAVEICGIKLRESCTQAWRW